MLEYRDVHAERDRDTLLTFHCRINYESETPYARRMTYEQYRETWLRTPQPESFLSDLADSMQHERTLAQIVEDNGEVAGYLWVTFTDVPGYDVTIAEIMDLIVAPEHRRRGIGQRMMTTIEKEARKRGATLLRSDTGIENVASQRLHEKVGFRPYRIHYEKVLRYDKPELTAPMDDFGRAVGEATELLRRHGYDYAILPDDLRRYAQADTFYPSAITWEEILKDELLVVHEVVEIAEMKRMGLEITKDVIVRNVDRVCEAHLRAAEVEIELARAMGNVAHIRDRLQVFGSWIEDRLVPPELKDEYEQAYARAKRLAASSRETNQGASRMPEVERVLNEMAETYRRKIGDDLSLTAQIDIQPGQRSWHVVVRPGRQVMVDCGPYDRPEFGLVMAQETLYEIYTGETTALTAAARERMSDPAPLDFEMGEGVQLTPELYATILAFIQRFFNASDPEMLVLDEAHSRVVRGAHAIPLYYHSGFRSAWYVVKKGERLNEPGETNPFPQAFVFVSGEGWAKIGDQTVEVKAGEAYYVPPGSDHVVWTENDEALTLIFLAWGEGA